MLTNSEKTPDNNPPVSPYEITQHQRAHSNRTFDRSIVSTSPTPNQNYVALVKDVFLLTLLPQFRLSFYVFALQPQVRTFPNPFCIFCRGGQILCRLDWEQTPDEEQGNCSLIFCAFYKAEATEEDTWFVKYEMNF